MKRVVPLTEQELYIAARRVGGATFTEIAEEIGLGYNRVHYLHYRVHDRAVETCDFMCRKMGLHGFSVAVLVFSDAVIDMLMSPKFEQHQQLFAELAKSRHLSVKQVHECLDDVFGNLWTNRHCDFLRSLVGPEAPTVCPSSEILLKALAEYGKNLMRSDTPIDLPLPAYVRPPFSGGDNGNEPKRKQKG